MTRPDDSQEQEVRQRLQALRTDSPDEAFRLALHRRLVEAGPPPAPSALARLSEALRQPWLRWPALGVAAGVAVFLLLSPRAPQGAPDEGGPATASAVLATSQVAVVRLNLSADVAVDAARIRIRLPPGLSFWSDGQALAQRDFEWTQPLSQGDNEIPVAVRGQQAGRYRIAVDALVGGQRVEDTVLIEVTRG